MGVRITNNIIMTLLTFYARYTLVVSEQDISQTIPFQLALLPLVMYVFSVLGSSLIDGIVKRTSRKKTYSLGAVMLIISSIMLYFLTHDTYNWVFLAVAISGFAQAICMNTGINMISEVVGTSGSSGAFVFGMYSLLDKFSNGFLIFFLLGS